MWATTKHPPSAASLKKPQPRSWPRLSWLELALLLASMIVWLLVSTLSLASPTKPLTYASASSSRSSDLLVSAPKSTSSTLILTVYRRSSRRVESARA